MRDLLDAPELRLTPLSGHELLDRPVRGLYGTELPDPRRYLSGGELVVSGLLWHTGPRDSEVFVAALADAGAAALAASETEARRVPPDLVAACAGLDVALLEVPLDLSFAVITEHVVQRLAGERAGQLGRHQRLLAVVAGGGDVEALVRAGTAELDAPCAVLTTTGRLVAGVPPDDPERVVRDFLRASRLPVPTRGATLFAAPEGGDRVTGWVLVVDGEHLRDDVAAELASLVGLARDRIAQHRLVENLPAAALLRLVATGAPAVASHVAAAGLDPDGPLRVLVASSTDDHLAAPVLDELLTPLCRGALIGVVDGRAWALAPDWPDDGADAVRAALRVLEPGLGRSRVVVGISSAAGVAGLRGAAQEADHAHGLGERRPGSAVVTAGEEIALHQLLLAGLPEELRDSLRRRVLGPVLAHDAAGGADLLGTLRVFLDCSGSWTTAAARLHVHVNTLRYRIGRVEHLLGVDLSDFRQRVDVLLALDMG
ncbi:helix-turn-helix domain-containing protein [Umezawaea beigongshangensis]|uniref:helix-turn-helix domain-containing protein n=1 Tax=Umezawaea beigongshangensis TaxID=2780383 RepID=UPI0027DE8672|nr:helix-turn-helix domain-containing protein [Umezawaea beigongshangensis]